MFFTQFVKQNKPKSQRLIQEFKSSKHHVFGKCQKRMPPRSIILGPKGKNNCCFKNGQHFVWGLLGTHPHPQKATHQHSPTFTHTHDMRPQQNNNKHARYPRSGRNRTSTNMHDTRAATEQQQTWMFFKAEQATTTIITPPPRKYPVIFCLGGR